jgi:hypothetical protein
MTDIVAHLCKVLPTVLLVAIKFEGTYYCTVQAVAAWPTLSLI